jgi:lysophospholipase L1-like esterase
LSVVCAVAAALTVFGSAEARAASPVVPRTAEAFHPEFAPVHFRGRVDYSDPAGPRFSWSATGLFARVSGTRIDVKLGDAASAFETDGPGPDALEVWVDGTGPSVITLTLGTATYNLASGLAAGPHDVEIIKRTEGQFGTVQFLGFVQPVIPTPRPAEHKIEFIGDSITAGYGIDMWMDPTCTVATDEDAYLAYSTVTARMLRADYFVEAWSGRGMYENWDGSTTNTLPTFYGRMLAGDASSVWDFSLWTPDVVVVNLGTNDAFATPGPDGHFVAAYEAFLSRLRSAYPRAFLITVVPGTMLWDAVIAVERSLVAEVVDSFARKGDRRVVMLEFPIENENLNTAGCGDHPSLVTQQLMATQLAGKIRELTGW